MKPSLQVRLSQHLALTPQLQQSIRLLQLSTLELHQEVEQMLEQNPFLEEDVEPGDEREQPAPMVETASRTSSSETERDTERERDADVADGESSPEFDAPDASDWQEAAYGDDDDTPRELGVSRQASSDEDDLDPAERSTMAVSLAEHLRDQLRGMRLTPEDAAAVEVLIESLDEDGYLADPIEEIVARLADPDDAERVEDLTDRLNCGLKWLQSMEPTGVGARGLSECLILQLRALDGPQVDAQARVVAILICKNHLADLARRDMRKLTAALGVDEDEVKAAQALIVQLEPKPGRPFVQTEANIVVPDVIVQKAGRGWRVVLNPDVMPKLRINDLYAQALRQHRGSEGGPALSARLQEARWFVKNILQRFETIQRVSQAIVERQKNFFTHGEIAMKPLVLREIADELGLHESTISRVTTAKYMSTPFGTFELKYFFGSSLNTEAGGNASSTAVRALIRQLVAAESPAAPLSDSQLSKMLEEQGIQVARRTVAKYREALRIAPANLRKAL